MTELLPAVLPGLFALAGLLVGAWIAGAFRRAPFYSPPPVADPKQPSLTELEPCEHEYKPGDVVLVKVPGGKTETLTITHIHKCDDLVGHYLMSGEQFIPVDWIVGGYRP